MVWKYNQKVLEWNGISMQSKVDEASQLLKDKYQYNGPFYMYNSALLRERINILSTALKNYLIYYSVKSLSNIHILKEIQKHSHVGIDVVSKGEIERGLQAGFRAEQIVFAGVGKTEEDILFAIQHNIKSIHIESLQELALIDRLSTQKQTYVNVALRINPNIFVKTHAYIRTGSGSDKFGIDYDNRKHALHIIQNSKYIRLQGFHLHLGSQLFRVKDYIKALKKILHVAEEVKKAYNHDIQYITLGGGFGIEYTNPLIDTPQEFPLSNLTKALSKIHCDYTICFEPGRFLSAPIGILVTHVLYIKEKRNKHIAIVDAGMTDIIRPALYQAVHPVISLNGDNYYSSPKTRYDIVGPICESSDFIARYILLNPIQQGDTLLILFAGAYCSVMSSQYNSRPLIPEILFDQDTVRVIRKPQNIQELIDLEVRC